MSNILTILIFFPALAAMLGFVVDKNSARAYGISIAAIEFLLSVWLWISFDSSIGTMQFVEFMPIIKDFGVNYYVGVDGISLFVVVMATFMTLIGMMSLSVTTEIKNMIITLLFLEMTLVGVFVALDAIIFYLFWELSLVPMLYIIGAWGGPLRVYAAVKFFLYTFAGSLVMLVGILYMAYIFHEASSVWTFSITEWYRLTLPVETQLWLFAAFFFGFAIKVPMVPFHTWLPYAHGQAPTIGSVILAAVLLKMGTYGFVRFSLPMFPDASVMMIPYIAILSIIMIIYTAMIAYAQKDMKQVIAYSSVSHMGIIMLGLFAMNSIGISGSIFQMISHGIVSGALFMLVGMIYDRRHTKLMSEFGGLASVMPKFALIFGIMLMASVGLPLTIGFVGEFMVLMGFFIVSPLLSIIAGTSIILGAVYMLALFKKSFFGPVTNNENLKLKDLTGIEIASLVPLVAVVIWLGIAPSSMLQTIDKSVNNTLILMSHKAQLPTTQNIIFIAPQSMIKEAK